MVTNNYTTGVLLVNLGTPRSPQKSDVKRYLIEFLTDKRVITLPWLKRQLLVRGRIVPKRLQQSTEAYQKIWQPAGSPLLLYGNLVKDALQASLGTSFQVELGMRYQEPSIDKGLKKLMKKDMDHLIVLPLFPQYASATTGSVHHKVLELLTQYVSVPKLTLLSQFYAHPDFIQAILDNARAKNLEYDHFLFSFHGLPEKEIESSPDYLVQCYGTAEALVKGLKLSQDRYTICFQSRLGKDPWLQPYTSDIIHRLAKEGNKKVLVFCPSFVCDCLETLYEISIEYAQEFKRYGGEQLDLVPGLNAHPAWIDCLRKMILDI